MEFNQWFKKRSLNEAHGSSENLPITLQTAIANLSTYNDFGFYLVFPKTVTTNTFVMSGQQIDDMYERLKNQYERIIKVHKAEETKPDTKQKIKEKLPDLMKLGNELKTELINWKTANPKWAKTDYTVYNKKIMKSDIREEFFDGEHPFDGLGIGSRKTTNFNPKTGGIVNPKMEVEDKKIIISKPFLSALIGNENILKIADEYKDELTKKGYHVTLKQSKNNFELLFYNNEKAQRAFYYLKQNA